MPKATESLCHKVENIVGMDKRCKTKHSFGVISAKFLLDRLELKRKVLFPEQQDLPTLFADFIFG